MNTEVISAILKILNKGTVDFNQLATTILTGLKTEQKTENTDLEKLRNLVSIVKATENNSVLSKYIPEGVKEQSRRAIIVAEYCSQDCLGDHLTEEQLGLVIDDLDDFIRQTEKNLTDNLTEVLSKAGIRI